MLKIHALINSDFKDDLRRKRVDYLEILKELGSLLICAVEESFGIAGKFDVSFTMTEAIVVINGSPLQIEIIYMMTKDQYGCKNPFDFGSEKQKEVAKKIKLVITKWSKKWQIFAGVPVRFIPS